MTDEKFLDQKMDRREFLKKAGNGRSRNSLALTGSTAILSYHFENDFSFSSIAFRFRS